MYARLIGLQSEQGGQVLVPSPQPCCTRTRRVLSIGIRHATTAAMWAVIQHNVRLALILFQGRREFAENCEAWVIAPTLHTPGRLRLSHGRYAVIYQLPGFKIYWYH